MKRVAIALGLGALLFVGQPIAAEQADPGFTFKRVKPGGIAGKRLINIQIEPEPEVERVLDHVIELPSEVALALPKAAVPEDVSSDLAWFWGRMSPSLSDAGYGKLPRAVAVLTAEPAKAQAITPQATTLARIVEQYGAQILTATAGTEISPALVASVIAVESAGRVDAKSSAGARGLMQLMPATAERFGVQKIEDPMQNIRGGVEYLAFLLDKFDGDALLALAGYNAGEGAVARNGGVPDYAETRAYVPKVVAAWTVAQNLCRLPPQRVTDGCLFDSLRVAAQ